LGGGDRRIRDPISKNKPDVVVHTCNPSYVGGIGRKTVSEAKPRQKSLRPYLKNKKG
jgi:hypothetical protein